MTLTNPKLIYTKAVLFVLTGFLASALILMELPSLRIAALLLIAIWCFARAYYFAFTSFSTTWIPLTNSRGWDRCSAISSRAGRTDGWERLSSTRSDLRHGKMQVSFAGRLKIKSSL
jgi:hypothetical protein